MSTEKPLLSVDGLETSFYTEEGEVRAVNDVSYQIDRGERFAVVGESGAGKSVTSLSLMRLIDDPGRIKGGDVTFRSENAVATLARKFPEGVATENSPGFIHVTELRADSGTVGEDPGATVRDRPEEVATELRDGSLHVEAGYVDVLDAPDEAMRELRGAEIAMIFQDPHTALNPVYTVGEQISEAIRKHLDMDEEAARERAIEMLDRVGIPDAEERYTNYPHEFSGGMQQRAVIAIALSCNPALIVADEPTTALDVTIEAQILDLIKELNREIGMAVLLVTHDLGVVAEVCDRVAVMYAGRIVEYADVEALFTDPRHPYTKGLLSCVPNPAEADQELEPIGGEVPDLSNTPNGCNFAPRCPYSIDDCHSVDPRLREVDDDHYAACIWEDPQ